MAGQRYVYDGDCFPRTDIDPQRYNSNYFAMELELESNVFFELRKRNGILPYKLQDSSPEELREIRDFFDVHRDTFFFLFDTSDLIGSILLLGNYVQSLAIAPMFQRKGYGEKLTKYVINYAYRQGHRTVVLDIMDGNVAAERFYAKLGFRKAEER